MTIDAATFRELQETAGADFVAELVDTFLQDAPQLLGQLRASLQSRSADGFRRAAHSLKSNGQTFGATEVARIARELELGGLPPDASGVDALQAAFEAAAAQLREMRRG